MGSVPPEDLEICIFGACVRVLIFRAEAVGVLAAAGCFIGEPLLREDFVGRCAWEADLGVPVVRIGFPDAGVGVGFWFTIPKMKLEFNSKQKLAW